ncbi:trypsin-like peptidase domain-containing protein [Micromonospora echinofusca]|uniref:trypsin-like peptidase domain-containing protein n=1 Tax=Micromonospora echinofusca TaxID=47858 RepID=UPI00202194BF|nr:trypsin-like peptidase domain-containing protein [Micromonospora sp. MSM11]MCL7456615.1 trypsin-like peptidase domain-containing protein [Micromonospora sp. MSM11]
MTEHESDPQRRPAHPDAEPSHPTAELPRAERAQSDSAPTVGFATTSGDAPTVGLTTHPAGAAAPAAGGSVPAGGDAPRAGEPGATTGDGAPSAAGPARAPDAAGPPAPPAPPGPFAPAPQYPLPGQHQPGQPAHPYAAGQPGHPHLAGQPGHPQAAGQPGGPWYGQQSGWSGGGQPGQPYGHQPHPSGQPVPPWAAPQTGPRPGRIAKFAGAGVAVFALMLGSGVAGGALALAVDDDSGITRTYSAAPVINGADLPRIAAAVQPSVVSIATGNGEGSGVILTADGFVLTNNHVIASATDGKVVVTFADGKTAQAQIRGTDPKTDLAVVKADGVSGLKAATFGDSDAMQVGDQVLALGSPLGLQGSVTAGILSARDRTIQAGSGEQRQEPNQGASSIAGLLQTDAPINPGNSGGALVNTRGEVIGINTAIATAGQGSSGNIGVGFAIPSNKAKDVAGKLQRGEKVSHPSLGVSVTAAEGGGALVAAVTPGSAAEKAGLQRGDVITRFGDKVVNDSDDLVGAVQAGKVGDRVEVTYKRNGTEARATVTLAETS